MASDDARACPSDLDGEHNLADLSHTKPAFYASDRAAPLAATSGVVACADEDRVLDAAGATDEPTHVTPEALIETLRELSRATEPSGAPDTNEVGARPVIWHTSEDDHSTLIFVAHESAPAPGRYSLRLAAPVLGAVALVCLLWLPTQRRAPSSRPLKAQSELMKHAASPDPTKPALVVAPEQQRESPSPPVAPAALLPMVELPSQPPLLVDPVLDPVLDDDTLDGPSDGDSDDTPTKQRRGTRALMRAQRQLADQEYDAAAFNFERAIEYNPHDSVAYAGLGAAQLGRGKWGEAVRAYRKAVALSPYQAELRAALGRAYEQGGKPRMAARAYRRALKLDPTVSTSPQILAPP